MKEEKLVNQVNLHTGRLPVVVIQIYVCSDPSQSLNYSGNNHNNDETQTRIILSLLSLHFLLNPGQAGQRSFC